MVSSDVADKYIKALNRLKVLPIRNQWVSNLGVCPLYAYTYFLMQREVTVKLSDKDKVLRFMLNKFGLDFRNGFTAAIDSLESESEDPNYVKGYEHGEKVRKKLWKK